jgi:fluoroacetyl-CoA thioesterase
MAHLLRVGLIGEANIIADDSQSALTLGSGSLSVFATPAMLALMENAAVRALEPVLDDGYSSVGIEVNIRHISATPLGETITAVAEVTRVEDRRVTFEIRAWDDREMIGEGTHVRFIIHVDRFLERLQDRG